MFSTIQSEILDGIVSIGLEPALCVQVGENFGVVCLTNMGMLCTACRKHQCLHTAHLKKLIEDISESGKDMLAELEPFAADSPIATKQQNLIKTVSTNVIPFDLPAHLRNLLVMDYSQRFHILDGVAQLVPHSSQPCPQCCVSGSWSDDTFLSQENFIVTLQRCIPAKGMYKVMLTSIIIIFFNSIHEEVFDCRLLCSTFI